MSERQLFFSIKCHLRLRLGSIASMKKKYYNQHSVPVKYINNNQKEMCFTNKDLIDRLILITPFLSLSLTNLQPDSTFSPVKLNPAWRTRNASTSSLVRHFNKSCVWVVTLITSSQISLASMLLLFLYNCKQTRTSKCPITLSGYQNVDLHLQSNQNPDNKKVV